MGSVLTGLLPAMMINRQHVYLLLKGLAGSLKTNQKGQSRKAMTGLQFGVSIALLVGTAGVFSQINHMKARDLGFSAGQKLILQAPRVPMSKEDGIQRAIAFRNGATALAGVESVSLSTSIPGRTLSRKSGVRLMGQDAESAQAFRINGADYHFLDTYGLNVIAGQEFSERIGFSQELIDYNKGRVNFGTDDHSVVLNESATRAFGFASPEEAVDKEIEFFGTRKRIIGVIADYHQRSLHHQPEPTILYLQFVYGRYFTVDLSGTDDMQGLIASIKKEWASVYPEAPFDYSFFDDHFDRQYQADQQFGSAIGLFSMVAIAVSLIGLIGIALGSANRRVREIGIRKVMGATRQQIIQLLSRETVVLIVVSALVAVPVAWFGLQRWLEDFAYRSEPGVITLLGPVAAILIVSVLSGGLIAWRAARANPVQSLRGE